MSVYGRGDTSDLEHGELLVNSVKGSRRKHIPSGEWECMECGHIRVGDKPPSVCPDCGASSDDFEYFEYEEDDFIDYQ